MTEEHLRERRARQYHTPPSQQSEQPGTMSPIADGEAAFARSPLGAIRLSGRGNSPVRHAALHKTQRKHGNRAIQRHIASNAQGAASMRTSPPLRPASPRVTIQRFEITDFLNPVHEWITAASLQAAGVVSPGSTYDSPEAQEYSRGVRWNDDPNGRMTDKNEFATTYGGGASFLHHMDNDEQEANRRMKEREPGFGPGDDLQARNHFGDLQFLHGMASEEGEEPEETRRKMLMWAEFTSKVAQGQIGGDVMLGDLGLGADPNSDKDDDPELRELSGMFPQMQSRDVNQLFGIEGTRETMYNMETEGKGDVRKRATGSLLHMIQDSHAGGHSERDADDNIVSFHSYTNQDHTKHGHSDAPGEGESVMDQLLNTHGAPQAIEHSAQVLRMLNNQDPYGIEPKATPTDWEDIKAHLEKEVFPLSGQAEPADAGYEYEKEGGWAGRLLGSLPGKKDVATKYSHDIAVPTEFLKQNTTDQWNSGIQSAQNAAWMRWERAENNAQDPQNSPHSTPFRTIPDWLGGVWPVMESTQPQKDPYAEPEGYDGGPYSEGSNRVPGWEW